MVIQYSASQAPDILGQILELQARNLAVHLSPAEATEQGFVTVRHEPSTLRQICGSHGHVVALEGGHIVGYALVMLKEFAGSIPVLVPLFELLDRIPFGSATVGDLDYFVMGQVCVAKEFRGTGVFRGLYDEMRSRMSGAFPLVVTEVATRNARSLRAHAKVGFRSLHRYVAPEGEEWDVVAWDWLPCKK
jgi:GNAT superfamily N-acetyltransferase